MYDVCLFEDDNGLVMQVNEIFGGDGCSGTDTLGTDAVSDTPIVYGAGRGTTTVNYGVNYDENVG